MNKPVPVVEIVVHRSSDRTIYITVASQDARAWVEDEAREYGSLHTERGVSWDYTLFVSSIYDPADVERWLRDGYREDTDG